MIPEHGIESGKVMTQRVCPIRAAARTWKPCEYEVDTQSDTSAQIWEWKLKVLLAHGADVSARLE